MSVALAMEALAGLTVLLMVGLLLSIVSHRLRISNLFLLLLGGLGLAYLNHYGIIRIAFSQVLVVSLAIITLVMVVFDGASRFPVKRVDIYSLPAVKITLFFLMMNIILVSLVAAYFFFDTMSVSGILFAVIIAITMSGTDPTSIFHMIGSSRAHKAVQVLELESIFNSPLTVILPLIVFEIINSLTTGARALSSVLIGQITPLLLEITAGIGLGILFGYFIAKWLRKYTSRSLSPIILLTGALFSYLLAEHIGGSGVLAVATMGVFFGNMVARNSEEMHSFNEILTNIFMILIFLLIGFLVDIQFSWFFLLKVFILFLVVLLVRFFTLEYSLPHSKYSLKEILFMTFMIPKGVAVAVVVLSLAVLEIGSGYAAQLHTVVQVIVMGMIMSLLFATIIARLDRRLLSPTPSTDPVDSKPSKVKVKTLSVKNVKPKKGGGKKIVLKKTSNKPKTSKKPRKPQKRA